MFDAERVRELANADFEFTNAARFWDATIRIEFGPSPYLLELRGGRIERFEPDRSAGSRWDLRIAAPSEGWAEFLKPVPKAFFHDLFAAMWRENFTVEGGVFSWGPYYPALRRFFEIMRGAGSR